jgi:hypothetical protein
VDAGSSSMLSRKTKAATKWTPGAHKRSMRHTKNPECLLITAELADFDPERPGH